RGFVASTSGGSTIGGGRIIRVLAPKARKGEEHAQTVAALASARLDERVALDIKSSAFAGLGVADLVRRLGVPAEALRAPLGRLIAAGEMLVTGAKTDAGGGGAAAIDEHAHYLHAQAVAELEQRIGKLVAAAEGDGIARELLRTQLPAALPVRSYDAILAGLEKRGAIA